MNQHEEDRAHTKLRELLGPYVLGGLDADDRAQLEAHLPTCTSCRDELATYAGLPALLRAGAASAHRVTPDAALGDAIGALRTRRRRGRLLLTAAAAVVLIAGAGAGTAVVLGPDEPVSTTLALSAPAGVSATGATSLSARPWGTSVDLDLRGLPQDEHFVAWLVSPEGERQQVATWGSTDNGEAQVTGAAALAPRDLPGARHRLRRRSGALRRHSGSFSTGADDRMPGLVVLTSTTNSTLPGFSGPGTNLANLFNLSGVTDRSKNDVELWDTWIVGAPIAGKDVTTTLTVAVIDDLNDDGIYNDAPGVVTDQNADGRIDRRDLEAIGVASKVETVDFRINGAPA